MGWTAEQQREAYYADHDERKEYHRKWMADWRERNKEHVAEQQRAWRKNNPERAREIDRNKRLRNPARNMVNKSRQRAVKEGLEHTIKEADVLPLPTICPVLGIPLVYDSPKRTGASASLDRVNNLLGYIPGNVQVISWRANSLKSDASLAELEKLYHYYKELL